MARGFGSTLGNNSTDSIKTGYATAFATTHSVSAWIRVNGIGGGTFGRIYEAGATTGPPSLNLQNSTTLMAIGEAWSGSTGGNGQWTFNVNSGSAWQHICFSYNGASTANVPVAYLNGSAVTLTQLVAPAGTYGIAGNNLYIGNTSTGARNWDGTLAEFGFWNGAVLTASEAAALAKGVSPLLVRPSSLSLYVPMLGAGAGEPDWGPSHGAQTLTGTKSQNHAPVSFWMPPSPMAPVSRIAGSLALAQGAAGTALALKEKFAGHLSPTAPANRAAITGTETAATQPGRVTLADAAQGGLLTPADAGLYRVQISESL